MAAMLKLLDAQMITRLVQNPEKLDMNELLELSRGFFSLQAVVGLVNFIYGAVLRSMGKIANRLVSDDMFSEKVAQTLERSIPQRLQTEGGITASAATQFHRGNFIVVLVSIEQIDLRKMLQSKLDEKQMKRFDQVMYYLEFLPSWVKADLQNIILMQVGNGLLDRMPDSMTKQLREMGGLEVEVESKRLTEEAEFFFAVMKQMDEFAAKPKKEASTPSLPSSPSKAASPTPS